MVEGKTAALMATCTELGALAAFCSDKVCNIYRNFGRLIGLAFQVQDDLLGIWGNSSLTGKSSQSDLVTGKITLPVVYGLSVHGEFARRWKLGPIKAEEISKILELLEHEGAKEFAQAQATILLNKAITLLEEARPVGIAAEPLRNLALSLVNRLA
jgi:geranylgeranyl diphosphate synthase type I